MAADTQDESGKEKTPIALPAPPPGKGQIVFFRSGTVMGVAMGCSVNENGQKVSSLGAGRYFIMVTDPGRHEFMVKSEAKDALALEVEPDETQFASCSIKMGFLAGRPDIKPATEEEFRKHKSLKLVDDDDMGPGPGALRAAEVEAALAASTAPADTVDTAEGPDATAENPEMETAAAPEGAEPAEPASEEEAADAAASDAQPAADGSEGEMTAVMEGSAPAEPVSDTFTDGAAGTAPLDAQAAPAAGDDPVDPAAPMEAAPDGSTEPAPAIAE
jgi:hypothetical protein